MTTLSNRAPHARPRSARSTLGAVVVAALLSACGSTTAATTSATTSATTAVPTTRSGRQLSISVTGKAIDPSPAQVDLGVGETLTVTVTIDHDDLLHAHGFEIEKTLTAGAPTTVVLKGGEPGVYEVETHEPALTLLTIAVR